MQTSPVDVSAPTPRRGRRCLECRRRPLWLWPLLLLLAVGIPFLLTLLGKARVEGVLESRARAGLAAAGIEDARVSFDYRDGALEGVAADGSARDRAIELAAAIEGVRTVRSDIRVPAAAPAPVPAEPVTPAPEPAPTPAPAPTPPATVETPPPPPAEPQPVPVAADATLTLARSGTVTLTGTLPSDADRTALVEAASAAFAAGRVVDELTVVDENGSGATAVTPSVAALAAIVPALQRNALTASATVQGDALEVSATTGAGAAKSRLEKAVADTAADGVEPAVQVETSATAGLEVDLRNSLTLKGIQFASGSAEIDAGANARLDAAAKAIAAAEGLNVRIRGYTDSRGDSASNRDLSRARAQAVLDYLVAAGVPAGRLEAVGLGERNPIAPNTNERGRALNRRIEFHVSKG